MRIAAVETYLAEHVKRKVDDWAFRLALESPIGDLDRRRVTAENIVASKYVMYTNAMLARELASKGLTPASFVWMPPTDA